ncbi:Flp pilus assembly protein CpaB [Jannaschia seosinensis]|uniref:Flp pilus assembly protein CpaB n=1 Tax=Jannaschia seosinensis TaxID=313367 RepID=UPI0027B9689A|nr:Flp pilus assembly protein CpaB [Jannaschia seosinensis]
MLLVGLGLAGFAINTAKGRFEAYDSALNESKSQIIDVREVYVVNKQMSYGDELTPDDVTAVPWPVVALPPGSFETYEDVFPETAKGPRTVLRVMERYEPILAVKVTAPGEEAGLAATLTPGMRAFTLQVDVNSGVSGFLRPGDRVDVYWTGNGDHGGITRLIHTSLPLIAVDQQTDEERNSPTIARNVTVEAPPSVIAKLAQAQATGRLTMALVGVKDDTEAEVVEADVSTFLGVREPVQRREVCYAKVRRAGAQEASQVEIPCANSG